MEIASENDGKFGWYTGDLRRDKDNYQLAQQDAAAVISGNSFLDGIYADHLGGVGVMLHGRLDHEETITGNSRFELKGIDQAAGVLNDDYNGWTVGASGYDLIFTNEFDSTVYQAESLDGLEDNLKDWFPDHDEYRTVVEDWEFEFDHWPWKV